MGSDQVTQLFRTRKLVLLQPLFDQMLPGLGEHGSDQLQRLFGGEGTLVEQQAEVLKDDRQLIGLSRSLLEELDGLTCSKRGARGAGGYLGGFGVVALGDELLKVLDVQIVGAGQVGSGGQLDGQGRVGRILQQVGDDGGLVDADGQDLAATIDADDAGGGFVGGRDEDGLAGDAIHEQARARLQIVEMDEAVLGDEVDEAVSLRDLHGDREVVDGLVGEVDLDGLLGVDGQGRLVVDLDDVQLRPRGGADGKGEEFGVVGGAFESDGAKGGGVALDRLTDPTLPRIQLHGPGHSALLGRDADDDHPFLVIAGAIIDDLTTLHLDVERYVRTGQTDGGPSASPTYLKIRAPIKDLDGGGLTGIEDVPVIDGVLGHEAQGGLVEPLPKDDVFAHGMRLELLLLVEVEDLEGPLSGLKGDDVLVPVHDGTIGLDRSARDIVVVLQVDNDDLGRCVLRRSLANADEAIGFQGLEGGDQWRTFVRGLILGEGTSRTHELNPMAAGCHHKRQ